MSNAFWCGWCSAVALFALDRLVDGHAMFTQWLPSWVVLLLNGLCAVYLAFRMGRNA